MFCQNKFYVAGRVLELILLKLSFAISKKDFLSKAHIAYKECAETQYWLNLLYKSDYLNAEQFESLNKDCVELLKILTTITKTTKDNLTKAKKELIP